MCTVGGTGGRKGLEGRDWGESRQHVMLPDDGEKVVAHLLTGIGAGE